MLGGVFVNLILGVFIYSMTLFVYGDKYLSNDDLTDGVWFTDSFALDLGFENGDKILSADGNLVERFSEIPEKISHVEFQKALKKSVVFQKGPRKIFRERQGGSREVRFALQRFPRRPSGKWHGSKGALFGGSWIGKSSPGLDF